VKKKKQGTHDMRRTHVDQLLRHVLVVVETVKQLRSCVALPA
jgi:hypothetical protein